LFNHLAVWKLILIHWSKPNITSDGNNNIFTTFASVINSHVFSRRYAGCILRKAGSELQKYGFTGNKIAGQPIAEYGVVADRNSAGLSTVKT